MVAAIVAAADKALERAKWTPEEKNGSINAARLERQLMQESLLLVPQ